MPEGNLDDGSQLGQLLGGVGLDISDTLKVGCFVEGYVNTCPKAVIA
jgi:hypothetical protein